MKMLAIILNSGTTILQLGLGVWKAGDDEAECTVSTASNTTTQTGVVQLAHKIGLNTVALELKKPDD